MNAERLAGPCEALIILTCPQQFYSNFVDVDQKTK